MRTRPHIGGGIPGMMTRILLDHDAAGNAAGNATGESQGQAQEQQRQSQQQGQQQGQPQTLTVGADYLNNLLSSQARLAEIEQQAEAERQRQAAERDQLVAESTQRRQEFEALIGERDQRIATLTEQLNGLRQGIQRERVGRTVADAMAGVTFASDHARQQAAQALASRVSVAERDGDFVVTSPTGTDGGEHLRGLLRSEEFAHFLAPSSRGGAGGGGNKQQQGGGEKPPSLKDRFQARYAGRPGVPSAN